MTPDCRADTSDFGIDSTRLTRSQFDDLDSWIGGGGRGRFAIEGGIVEF